MADDLRCAPWTHAQQVDPIGSATPFDALLLVEWPLPWPNDVSDIEPLAPAAADPRATLMTVVPRPRPGGDEPDDGLLRVVHHRRVGTHRFAGVDHLVPQAEIPALLARLFDEPGADHLDLPSAVGVAPNDVLVCAHGRRDPCCARFGTLLQAELGLRLTDARVWRCSHTGGHRFAPTAITVADGRVWAWVDADLLIGVVGRTIDVAELAGHDRGTVALGSWAQAVEHELFAARGWAWLDVEIADAHTEVAGDGRSARVRLAWREPSGEERRADAEVVVTRVVPVLVCGEPPDQAKKSSNELAVRSLQIS